jgi:DNA-binding transcriptional ArsR family regulator
MGMGPDSTMASGGAGAAEVAGISPELHGLLANPFRHEIAMRMAARPYCATELVQVTGRRRRYVTEAIEELREAGVIELVEIRPGPNGKGGRAFYYGATRTIIEADEWEQLSASDQASLTGKRLAELQRDQVEALEAGTFHSHPHHTLIRDHRRLDGEGFRRQDEILRRAYDELVANAEASHARCSATGETAQLAVIGLTAFPAAPA